MIISIFLLLPSSISTGLVARPGCPNRCGKLPIPYPFGIGSDCSLDPSFNISCITSTSTDPPKAYITLRRMGAWWGAAAPRFAARGITPAALGIARITGFGRCSVMAVAVLPLPEVGFSPCSYAFIQEMRLGSRNQSVFSYNLEFLENNSKSFSDECMETTMAPVIGVFVVICMKLMDTLAAAFKDTRAMPTSPEDAKDRFTLKLTFFLLHHPSAYSIPVAKPGCLDQCGNLSIPFPFGIGSNCYMDPSFEISCNVSTNPPKAYLSALNAEIYDLNLTQIRVLYPKLAFACYNLSESRSLIIDLSATQFTLSTQNVLTALGCDDMAVAYGKSKNTRSFVGGSCAALCTVHPLH
ncbi:hypothetical protein SASPL_100224 [Salvia splendens]|uniref:Wall-associated receptor kinase galacturonan-binding domain-containing protein n=1 Tax=Salvia splendens TaxID=180675 RepID=A0A8X8YRP0_SALSN|nr:hypothetical protein SASPL_100224 [Salvia splendens]